MTESPETPPASRSSGMSVTSLALAIVAVTIFWSAEVAAGERVGAAQDVGYVVAAAVAVLFGVGAMVTGVLARRRVKRGTAARGGVALAGIVLGLVAFVMPAMLLAYVAYLLQSGYQEFEVCVRGAGTSYPSYLCMKDCPGLLDSLCRRAIGWNH